MEYSINQINNLLRTYPQQLKVKAPVLEEDSSAARTTQSPDRVSISAEGKRRLEEAEAKQPPT
ncbi:MAG: hypothetical protein AB7N91_15770 [Candidatus Tectimicrobiota bacterium]